MTRWPDIISAVTLTLGGDAAGGRSALLACWQASGVDDHAERCVLAHYLADLQAELPDEVAWDERALAEFAFVTDDALTPAGIPHAAGLAPSLHLNLGDGYLRQGRLGDAADQYRRGVSVLDALGEDGYGAMIRRGLAGLGERIDAARSAEVRLETDEGRRSRGVDLPSRVPSDGHGATARLPPR